MTVILLTPEELAFADAIAIKRNEENYGKKIPHGRVALLSSRQIHRVGNKGEIAVGKYLEIPDWREQIELATAKQKAYDLICRGQTIEVRTRSKLGELHNNFQVRVGKKFNADYGIMAATEIVPDDSPRVELLGWFTRDEWEEYHELHDFGVGIGEQFCFPQTEYHPMRKR